MKLKDNSPIRGGGIVGFPPTNWFKSNDLVESKGLGAGLPNLQKNVTLGVLKPPLDQRPGDPFSTEFRLHRKVENLTFARAQAPGDQEASHASVHFRHQELMRQVIRRIP